MKHHIYTPQKHTFFDNLVAFVASITAIGTAFDVQSGLPSKPFQANHFIVLEGKAEVTGCEFHIYTGSVLDELLANRWPTAIRIDEYPITTAFPAYRTCLTGLQGVQASIITSTFIQYFENNLNRINTRFGNDRANWPDPWKFGRVVRNALAHGGRIYFKNPNSDTVHWRSLSYSPTNNGRQLLFKDITSVEIILLMEEMEAFM